MAHRRGGFRGRSVGISQTQRRKKSWEGFADVGSETLGNRLVPPAIVGAGSSLQVSGITSASAELIGLVEGTVMRIRGSLDVPKSSIAAAANSLVVAFGIGFVTDEAFAVSAVPNPATPGGADWDGWLFFRSNLQGSLDANAGVMDSKAMRKWNSGQTLALIAGQATNDVAGVPSTVVQLLVRALFLRP